jgi:membrane protease YdiL (CAAX protease family)
VKGSVDALLPDTPEERRWLAAVSVGAGISEELLFRGFLFYYLTLWFPHIHSLECALVTSLIFGIGHLYQGWKGIVSTGLVGLVMAGLYALTGNLLVPMFVHAATDLRALLIFWNGSSQPAGTAEAA